MRNNSDRLSLVASIFVGDYDAVTARGLGIGYDAFASRVVQLIAAFCLPVLLVASARSETPSPVVADKPVPDWYVRGVAAALLDSTPGMLAEILKLPRVEQALGMITNSDVPEEERQRITQRLLDKLRRGDDENRLAAAVALSASAPELRTTVVGMLVKLAANQEPNVQASAANALGAIIPSDPEQRKTVVDTLVKLAGSGSPAIQKSAAAALGAIKPSEPEERESAVDTLVRLTASDNGDVQASAAASLGAIKPNDSEKRKIVVDALVGLAASDNWDVKRSVATALDTIKPSDPEQRSTVIEALVRLAAESDQDLQASAAAALGAINPRDPRQRRIVVDALVKLAAVDQPQKVSRSAADALGAINPNDHEQRKTVVDTLAKLATSSSSYVRRSAGAALHAIFASDPDQGKSAIDALVELAASDDSDVGYFAIAALGAVNPSDPGQRKIVVDVLVKLAASGDSDDQRYYAAGALGAINPSDPEQRKTVIDTLEKLAASDVWFVLEAVADALGAINPSDPEQRKTVVNTLAKLADDDNGYVKKSSAAALGAINPSDPELRRTVVNTLVKMAASYGPIGWGYVAQSAAASLAAISPSDPEQRKTVVDTLVKLAAAASDDGNVQQSVADALGAINPSDPEQHEAVATTLLKLAASDYDDAAASAITALLATGPLGADQVTHLLVQIDQDRAKATPRWRAIGWAFSGALPMGNDGAILMTFAGQPGAIPSERWPRDRKSAAKILGAFAKSWPGMQESKTLQGEIAQQAVTIVGRACPAAMDSGGGVLEKAADRVAQEWDRTLAWLRGWLGGAEAARCWQGDDRNTLSQLRDDFKKVDGLGAEARALDEDIAADGATPIVGQGVLAAGGWALIWTAFLAVFPYSARIRGAYLFNEKARGCLSLGFLPVIMTLLPFLRRRMLLPFRDELLADANLALLKGAEFYPGLRVRDREGRIRPIGEAIPDTRGKLLLLGESGLGKSTYLRVLTSHSRRTIAYLNARSCDEGVEAAMMLRVSNFESPEFFRGLIYAGDLAVIIDGLNEVSADARAGIIAFANSAGHANLIIATQPIEGIGGDRSPLTLATAYELLPLGRVDIAKFLKSRPARDNPNSAVKGEDYDGAVDKLLAKALDRAPESEAEREAEGVLQEQRAAELILSNPMDLTYGSELIALGQTPQPSQMIGQAFRLACQQFRATYDRDFPTLDFARKAVTLRREDRNWLKGDEFANEQGVLSHYRLIVPRSLNETADKQVTVMRFRHDKVMDVLTKRAFEVDEKLQVELIDDPRFRGVYLLFAQDVDRELARRIRDRLVSHAARTGDNGLSNEFVRLFDRGAVQSDDTPIPAGAKRGDTILPRLKGRSC